MEFPYIECEGGRRKVLYRPYLPIVVSAGQKNIHLPYALVDTGSDVTVLPIVIAHQLEIPLDDTEGILLDGASGSSFTAFPSRKPIDFMIEKRGSRSIVWKGVAYFAQQESVILLGHQGCLEKFDLTFHGPERTLGVLPRFKV